MSAFSTAVDAIFADPNMAVDAVYRSRTSGADVPCRAVRRQPDEITEYGGAQIVSATLRVDLRVSEVPAPLEGDLIILPGGRVVIEGAPIRDRLGLVWRCGTIPEDQACA